MLHLRTIIAGSRTLGLYHLNSASLQFDFPLIGTVISGHARGVDLAGEQWALERGIPVECYPAEWDKYGKSAGYRRNEVMADRAEALVAIWDGESRGTGHMIEVAERKGLLVKVYRFPRVKD